MNKEDITRLAQEAGFVGMDGDHGALRRFAALVASAERERILNICKEGLWDAEGIRYHLDTQARGDKHD